MRLDPNTPVRSLIAAIPSSVVLFEKFGIPLDPDDEKTLQELCRDHGIGFEDFVRAMNKIDWSQESSEYQSTGGK